MHEVDDRERATASSCVDGRGPDRHPHHGPALHLPVQRELDHEPDPRDVPRARLLLQPVPRASRSVREGGVLIMTPPHAVGVPPGPPPELHRLLRAGAGRDDRPARDRAELREVVRRGRVVPPPLPHVATPTTASTRSTCGTGARTRLQHLGRVIIVGGDAAGGAPARLHARLDAGRRPRDGRRRRRAATPRSPTSTTRRSSWRT